ncbi:outer membrane protein assembly factor BamA [candidate division KSB1 bacterium]
MKYSYLYKLIILISFSGLFSSSIYAQQVEEKFIASIEVEGNLTVDAEMVKMLSRLYSKIYPVPVPVYAEDFAGAIEALWGYNYFSDVQVLAKNPEDKYLNIVIKIKELPSLNQIILVGNDKIEDEQILTALNFYRGEKVVPSRVYTRRQGVIDLYTEKGYLLAEIDGEVIELDEDGKVDIIYTISEGEKVKIENIDFRGNDSFSEKTLRKQLKKTKEDGWFRGGDFNKLEYDEDLKNLINYYKKEGYRDAEVISDSIYYTNNMTDMNIFITVEEGEKYYIRNIEFEGNEKFTTEELKLAVNLFKGDTYNYEKLLNGHVALGDLYYDIGYLYSQINIPEQPVAKDSIDIKFVILEGIPVHVNKIRIQGNSKTKEKVIRREITIKPGDIFNKNELIRSQQRLGLLNFFSQVMPNVMSVDEEKIDVVFDMEEKSTDTANMSAGYSQRDGMIGSLGLSMANVMGNGQQMYIDWQFGRIFRSFQIGFTEPWLFDTPTVAGFSLFDTRRGGDFYGFSMESKGATLRVGRRLRWPDEYFRGDWFFEYSRNRYFDVRSDIDLRNILINRMQTTRISVTQVFSRDRRINLKDPAIVAEFPRRGSSVSLATQFGGGILGGTENFIKHTFNSEWFTPTFMDFVLYQNLNVGFINMMGDENDISLQQLFFMGGSAMSIGTSLRGYKDRMVGPLSRDGYPLGGKAMMKYTTEMRFNVSTSPTVYGLVFAEAGNNWINKKFVDPFNLKRSAGLGVRLFMPMIGMIGIDFGYGFDNYELGKRVGWMPHFQFGRTF